MDGNLNLIRERTEKTFRQSIAISRARSTTQRIATQNTQRKTLNAKPVETRNMRSISMFIHGRNAVRGCRDLAYDGLPIDSYYPIDENENNAVGGIDSTDQKQKKKKCHRRKIGVSRNMLIVEGPTFPRPIVHRSFGICWNCNQPGHHRAACSKSKRKTPFCYNCGKEDYTLATCPTCQTWYHSCGGSTNAITRDLWLLHKLDTDRTVACRCECHKYEFQIFILTFRLTGTITNISRVTINSF